MYVTFGSVAASVGLFPGLYRTTVDVLSDLDVHVLVTTGGQADPAELGPLPANVRAERWVAQEEALAHADAVVCHGGYGTMLGALAHGVPLVVMTLFGGDQRRNGRRIAEIGAGIALDEDGRMMFEPPGAEVIAALPGAVRRVLDDPGYGRAARRAGARHEPRQRVEGHAHGLVLGIARGAVPVEVLEQQPAAGRERREQARRCRGARRAGGRGSGRSSPPGGDRRGCRARGARGYDPYFGRKLVHELERVGLEDVAAEGRLGVYRGASPAADFLGLSLESVGGAMVEAGLVTRDELERGLASLDDPDSVFLSASMIAARGRRPSP